MMKLLIADDEESIRNGLKVIVDWEGLGFTVCAEASNGNEAVNNIKDYSPDVVLLDIKRPGLSGIEGMEEINRYSKMQGKKYTSEQPIHSALLPLNSCAFGASEWECRW